MGRRIGGVEIAEMRLGGASVDKVRVGGVDVLASAPPLDVAPTANGDAFDRSNRILEDATWTVRSGPQIEIYGYTLRSNNDGGTAYLAFDNPLSGADMRAGCDVSLAGSGYREGGPMARLDGSGTSGFSAIWDSNGRYRIYDGTTAIATLTAVGTSGTRRIEIETEGSFVRLYADGILKLEAESTAHAVGTYWGLRLYNQVARSIIVDNASGALFGAAPAAPVYSDDFAYAGPALSADWETRGSNTMTVATGAAVWDNAGGTSYMAYTTPVGADVDVTADVSLGGTGFREGGPVGRMGVSGNGGYSAMWDTSGRYSIRNGGTILAEVTGVGTTGTRAIRLTCVGSTIRLFADGVQQLEVTNATHTGDRFGMRIYNSVAGGTTRIEAISATQFAEVADVRAIAITDEGDIRTRTALRARGARNYLFNGDPANNAIIDNVGMVMAFPSTGNIANVRTNAPNAKLYGVYLGVLNIYDSERHTSSTNELAHPELVRMDDPADTYPNGTPLYIPFFDTDQVPNPSEGRVMTQYAAKVAEPGWVSVVSDRFTSASWANAIWFDDLILNWKIALAYDSPEGNVLYFQDPTLLQDFLDFMVAFRAANPGVWIMANLQPTRVYSYLFEGESNYSPLVEQIVAQLDGVWIEYGLWYDPVLDKGNNYNLSVVRNNFEFVQKLMALGVHPVSCHVAYGTNDATLPHPVIPIQQNVATGLIVDDGSIIYGDAAFCDDVVYSVGLGAALPLSQQVNANLQPTNTQTGALAVQGSTQCTWLRKFQGGIVLVHYGSTGTTFSFDLPEPMVDYRNQGATPFTSITFDTFGDFALLVPAP